MGSPRKIFLTGASAGFGLAIAHIACERGHQVWGTSRSLDRLPNFPGFHPIRLDLLESGKISEAYRSAETESGGIDVLINNAGSGTYGPIETLPLAMLHEEFQLLLLGQVELIQAALPYLRKKDAALILNVTSLSVDFPVPFMAAYSAAKAALSQYSSCLRLELSHTKVRCVDFRPGDFKTDFHQAMRRPESAENAHYEPDLAAAFQATDQHMNDAPDPRIAAAAVVQLLDNPKPPPIVAVGDLFQSRIAPALSKLVPNRSVIERGIRKYYRIRN